MALVYNETEIFYEDDRVILTYHRLKIPLIPFLNINTIDMQTLKDKNTVCTYGFQFGIPSLSTAIYKDIGKDKCLVSDLIHNYETKVPGLSSVSLTEVGKILLNQILNWESVNRVYTGWIDAKFLDNTKNEPLRGSKMPKNRFENAQELQNGKNKES